MGRKTWLEHRKSLACFLSPGVEQHSGGWAGRQRLQDLDWSGYCPLLCPAHWDEETPEQAGLGGATTFPASHRRGHVLCVCAHMRVCARSICACVGCAHVRMRMEVCMHGGAGRHMLCVHVCAHVCACLYLWFTFPRVPLRQGFDHCG